MQALAGANAALNLSQAADALTAGQTVKDANAADKAGGVGISVSVGASSSKATQSSSADTARGSIISAGANVSIQASGAGQASDLTVRGSSIQAAGTTKLKAEDQINLQAAQNTTQEASKQSSKSASVGLGIQLGAAGAQMGVTVNAAAGKGQGAGTDSRFTNSQVNGQRVELESGGDTNLQGAVVSANQVTANVGGNLTIESLQSTATYNEKNKSAGGAITFGPAPGGSLSLGQSKVNSDFKSVGEQSAIRAGDGGFQVNVQGNTSLSGGQITSTQAAIDAGANSFNGNTAEGLERLTTTDLQNSASYKASSASAGLSAGAAQPGASLSGGLSGIGIGSDSGRASSVTTAGISGLAGNSAARTGEATTAIKPIFDAEKVKNEIQAQVTITQEFNKQAGQAIKRYVATQRQALQEQANKAATPEDKASTEQAIRDVNMQERALNILVAGLTGMAGSVVTKEALGAAAERVNDFAPLFVMNLLRKAVVVSG
jgi:filamentous hemagglutinin